VLPGMDVATGVFLHVAGTAEVVNVVAVLFANELRWFETVCCELRYREVISK
jgi:hypothetical protein